MLFSLFLLLESQEKSPTKLCSPFFVGWFAPMFSVPKKSLRVTPRSPAAAGDPPPAASRPPAPRGHRWPRCKAPLKDATGDPPLGGVTGPSGPPMVDQTLGKVGKVGKSKHEKGDSSPAR